jgi:uncharacterized membrane protein
MSQSITPEERVAFRDFLSKIKQDRFRALMREGQPAVLTADDILKSEADGLARAAAMNAGFDEAVEFFFNLALTKPASSVDAGHRDMS